MGPTLEQVASLANLYLASREARRHKRQFPYVQEFEADLETHLLALREELSTGRYRPGDFVTFWVHDPKKRLISAAPYRDRVVHHAVVRLLEPLWERRFIYHSYACRKGKGTHAALDACQRFVRRFPFVLHADVRKYFPSVDHLLLEGLLFRVVRDPGLQGLLSLLIRHTGALEKVDGHFPGDDLFTPSMRTKGLPIGNLTSQFFANVFLDPVDHYVTDDLGFGAYARFMDDMIVCGESAEELARVRTAIEEFLSGIRLKLHPGKRAISRTEDGLRFLGFRVFAGHRRVTHDGKRRQERRIGELQRAFRCDRLSIDLVTCSMASMAGHLAHADTFYLRRSRSRWAVFQKARLAGGRGRRSVAVPIGTTTNPRT